MWSEIQTRGWNAFIEALAGAPERAVVVANELRGSAERGAAAWAHAVDAALWQALPEGPFPVLPEQVLSTGREGGGAAAGAAVVCVEGARAAWLSGWDDWTSNWLDLVSTFAEEETATVSTARSLARAFHFATIGSWSEAENAAIEASRLARSARLAPYVIDSTALHALTRLAADDLTQGLDAARRAMRMARTEELAQPSYLAGLVLARVRRLAGHFYLSSRILESLARVAPSQWTAWLAWERSLAGVPPDDAPEPAASLNRWAHAFQAGKRSVLPGLGAELHTAVLQYASFREDADALAAALGVTVACPPSIRSFRFDVAPQRASGFEGLPRPLGPQVVAIVDARTDAPPIRRLALAAPVASPYLCSARPGRPEAVLAALALEGRGGADVRPLFKHVYGFEYVPERHANVFDVVLHRARGLLESRGDIRRDGDTILFSFREPFSVPDTSLQGSLSERVLHSLAVRAKGSAKEIAEDLQMPLRTVQALLRELVDQGACTSERSARNVKYIVEDTTFKEPTALNWRRD